MRAVDFAVSRILPEALRQDTYDLGKKGMAKIMAEVARRYPDRFPEIVQKLGDLGRRAAWLQGYTTAPRDTQQVIDTSKYYGTNCDARWETSRRTCLPRNSRSDGRKF